MNEFALTLLKTAFFSTVTFCVLFLLKRILRFRIPPFVNIVLWAVLLVRLCFPNLPESTVSIYNFLPGSRAVFTGEILEGQYFGTRSRTHSGAEYIESVLAEEEIETAEQGISRSAEQLRYQRSCLIVAIYIIGLCLSLFTALIRYILFYYRALRYAFPCEEKSIQCAYAEAAKKLKLPKEQLPPLYSGSASMLVGVFRPFIIIDTEADVADISIIALHELNHFVHRDNFWILFWNMACCILWFCIPIWFVASDVRDEMEVLCDARTLRFPSVGQRQYASLLYRMADASSYRRAFVLQMSAVGARLKVRLRHIAFPKKQTVLQRIASSLLIAFGISVTLTNPVSSLFLNYDSYIETGKRISGNHYTDIASGDTLSGVRFYHIVYTTLKNRTGGYSSRIPEVLGDGSIKALTEAALQADIAFWGYEDYMANIASTEAITHAQAAVILDTMMRLLRGNARLSYGEILPRQIREDTLANIMQRVAQSDRKALLSAYNRGSQDAGYDYAETYTVETMARILNHIENDWLRRKFISFYYQQDIADYLANNSKVTNIAATAYDYVFSLHPGILEREKRIVKDIVAITRTGIREDVFYLKPQPDLYADAYIADLYQSAGFDARALHEEYAALGYSDCDPLAESFYWRAYRPAPRIRNSSGIAAVDTIVNTLHSYGILEIKNSTFPFNASLTFGESMRILCLLYAGMTSE